MFIYFFFLYKELIASMPDDIIEMRRLGLIK